MVSGSINSTIRLWDKRDGSCIAMLKGHTGKVTSVQLDEQADNVLSGAMDSSVRYAKPHIHVKFQISSHNIWSAAGMLRPETAGITGLWIRKRNQKSAF